MLQAASREVPIFKSGMDGMQHSMQQKQQSLLPFKKEKKGVRRSLLPALAMAQGLKVPVSKDKFADIIENCGMPANWRGDKKVRQALVRLAMCGELAEDNGVVMTIDESNYTGGHTNGALVFKCSLCTYVGERYYHAGALCDFCVTWGAHSAFFVRGHAIVRNLGPKCNETNYACMISCACVRKMRDALRCEKG
jgi:hypothetical protein